jgi:nucleoside phosphorylase
MPSGHKQLTCTDYHVAWISPLPDVELMPARLMLDEEHPTPRYDTHYDENTYICGTLNGHAVVIATCPKGETGNVNAARLTGIMFKTFPNIRMAVLVGIGGGIPRPIASQNALEDIHLGDVVVGDPGDGKPACVYHDRGKAKVGGVFEMVGTMQSAEWRLTQALGILASDHELGRTNFTSQLERLKSHTKFNRPEYALDRLFKAAYHHTGSHGSGCTECDHAQIVQRRERNELDQRTFVFHQGTIATGNSVIQDGEHRDKIGASCNGALCVEMEAAGVDVYRRCLIIRGISDYADSHKNDVWKFYAAAKAAAFTRELMCKIPPAEVKAMPSVYDPEPRGTRRVSVWKDDGVGRDSPHKSKPASRVRPAVPPKSRSLKAPVTEDAESAKHGTRSSATEDGVQAKNELEKTSESSLDHASEFTMHPSCMVTFPTMRKRHGRANGRVTGCILGHIPVIVHKCGDFLIRKGTCSVVVMPSNSNMSNRH